MKREEDETRSAMKLQPLTNFIFRTKIEQLLLTAGYMLRKWKWEGNAQQAAPTDTNTGQA